MARLFDEAVEGVCQQYACADRDQQVNFVYESGRFHPINHDISDILVDQVDRIRDGAEEDEDLRTQELQPAGEDHVEKGDEQQCEHRVLDTLEKDVVDDRHRDHHVVPETVAVLPYGIEHHTDDEHMAEACDGIFPYDRSQFGVDGAVDDLDQHGCRKPAKCDWHDVLRLPEQQQYPHQYVEGQFHTECPVDAVDPVDAREEVLQHGHVDQGLAEANFEVIHYRHRNDDEREDDGEHIRWIQPDGPLDGEVGGGPCPHDGHIDYESADDEEQLHAVFTEPEPVDIAILQVAEASVVVGCVVEEDDRNGGEPPQCINLCEAFIL